MNKEEFKINKSDQEMWFFPWTLKMVLILEICSS